MPHVTLEYSQGLDDFSPRAVLNTINHTVLASAQFEEADIKSRAVALDCVLMGINPEPREFVHVTLGLLSGRSPEIKQKLSQQILQTLLNCLSKPKQGEVQISVDIIEMDREIYAKRTLYSTS